MIETPQHAMITREEAQKRQREAKHHTVVCEGKYAAHYVHDQATGITTLVREGKIPLSNAQEATEIEQP